MLFSQCLPRLQTRFFVALANKGSKREHKYANKRQILPAWLELLLLLLGCPLGQDPGSPC